MSIRSGAALGNGAKISNNFNISNMVVRMIRIKNIARELYLLQTRSDRGYAI